jgi:hypothetical protein
MEGNKAGVMGMSRPALNPEYWSNGVMQKNKRMFLLLQYSNTPALHFTSFDLEIHFDHPGTL